MIDQNSTFIPSLENLYNNFLSNHSNQFENQKVNSKAIYGRVARMWASLVREWHAYYLLLSIGEKFNLNEEVIIRNDELDTHKGIDIYLKNKENKEKSIKLDILQSTKRANFFRYKKDKIRVKDEDIPGSKYKILLGDGYIETTKIINNWYLLDNDYALRIIKYFSEVLKQS
tara:strand:- start:74 stop:589 length:516 start_codon:yes stop_codon:yes gene_type:complete